MKNSQLSLIQLKKLMEDFEAEFRQKTKDPGSFLTMQELETMWSNFRRNTNMVCSDMVQSLLQEVDEKALVRKKKRVCKTRD